MLAKLTDMTEKEVFGTLKVIFTLTVLWIIGGVGIILIHLMNHNVDVLGYFHQIAFLFIGIFAFLLAFYILYKPLYKRFVQKMATLVYPY